MYVCIITCKGCVFLKEKKFTLFSSSLCSSWPWSSWRPSRLKNLRAARKRRAREAASTARMNARAHARMREEAKNGASASVHVIPRTSSVSRAADQKVKAKRREEKSKTKNIRDFFWMKMPSRSATNREGQLHDWYAQFMRAYNKDLGTKAIYRSWLIFWPRLWQQCRLWLMQSYYF